MLRNDPLTKWREELGRTYLSLDFEPVGDDPFEYTIQPIAASDTVRAIRVRTSPGYTFRDKALVTSSNQGTVGFCYSLTGSYTFHNQRREGRLGRGQPTLFDNSIVRHTGSNGPSDRICIIVEQKHVISSGSDHDLLVDNPWLRPSPALRLLQRYVAMLMAGPPGGSSPQLAALACQHVLELMRASAAEQLERRATSGAEPEDLSGARLRVAQADIRDNHTDPELTVDAVAARLGLSTRQLQRLFEQAGIRFTECVNELRLTSAHDALADPRMRGRSVLDIAMDAGFSDVSHFNRQFKRRFDSTPRAVRSRGHNGARS